MITLTKGASVLVKRIVATKGPHHLRVEQVEGGCSGRYYSVVFEKRKGSNDNVFTTEGVKVFVDRSIKQKESAIIDNIRTMNGPTLISSNPLFRVNLFIHD